MSAPVEPGRRSAAYSTAAVALTLVLSAAAVGTIDPWPARLPLHLGLYVAAGAAWLGCALLLLRNRPTRLTVGLGLAGAIVLRLWALATPPAHSDDVHRYLWDGRVSAYGINPYRYAPDAPELVPLRDESWAELNNRELPTIYPPAAQLFFRLTALGPSPLFVWKGLAGLADVATASTIALLAGPGAALTWLLSPLVLIELIRNAHLDGVAVALFVLGLAALGRRRSGWAGALMGLATAVKLLPVFVVAGARDRALRRSALLVIVLVTLPFAGAGPRILGSLGEYGRRWRSNDGAFAVLHAGAAALVHLAGKRRATDETRLGEGGWATRLITGRDRDEAYPDELAGALARLFAFALFLTVVLRARASPRPLMHLVETGIGAFLLLTPSLHPWYCAWALPAVLLGSGGHGRGLAWLWLCATAPLGHVPLVDYLGGHGWHDPAWTRIVEHGPAWLLCADFARRGASDKLNS